MTLWAWLKRGQGKRLRSQYRYLMRFLQNPSKPAPKTAKGPDLGANPRVGEPNCADPEDAHAANENTCDNNRWGTSVSKNLHVLSRGTDILVATPGRLIDLLERDGVDLSKINHLVLDEADQMLDIGFIHALRKIVSYINEERQSQLFSATMSKQMEQLSRAYLKNPSKVEVNPPNRTAENIAQSVQFVQKPQKPEALRTILNAHPKLASLIFVRTKHGAERLKDSLVADGFKATSVHGNKSQGQRERAIKQFRAGEMQILVATDVAARGIDIPLVGLVVNYELSNVPENYVHRIGRTARAGRSGIAVTLCTSEEVKQLRAIEKLIKMEIYVDGETPDHMHTLKRGSAPEVLQTEAAQASRCIQIGKSGKFTKAKAPNKRTARRKKTAA